MAYNQYYAGPPGQPRPAMQPGNFAPPASNIGGPPGVQPFGRPGGAAPGGFSPPPMSGAPGGFPPPNTGMMAPPMSTAPGGYAPPNGGVAAPPMSNAPRAMFYNVATGTPTVTTAAPPPTNMMGMPPPPTNMGGPPVGVGGGMGMGMGGVPAPPPMNQFQSPTAAMYGGQAQNWNAGGAAPNTGYPGDASAGGPVPGATVGGAGATTVMQPQQSGGAADYVGGGQLPLLDEMDTSIACHSKYMRCNVSKIVNTQQQFQACKLPVGIVCQPLAHHSQTVNNNGGANEPPELVDFGATGIIRCKRCRAYINCYVTWTDNGRRWRCNFCGMLNDVPSSYFSHLDQNGQRRDKLQRPELMNASVEFLASGDYMVRPPQPPAYFFLIDVSGAATQSGMLQSLVNAVKQAFESIPGRPRTQIGKTCSIH